MRSRGEAAAAWYTEGDRKFNKGERDGSYRPFYIISLIDGEKILTA